MLFFVLYFRPEKITLRITISILMLFHGITKLKPGGIDFIFTMLADEHLPDIFAYGVYVGELIIPAFLLIGFKTRLSSMAYAVNMLFTIWLGYSDKIFSLTPKGGWSIELNLLYLMGAVVLVFNGGGKYALDKKHEIQVVPCEQP